MQTGKNPGIAAHLPELISEFISLDDREAERRETFGCQRAPVGRAVSRHARRLRGALRPMTQQTPVGNKEMISMLLAASVPIVSGNAFGKL